MRTVKRVFALLPLCAGPVPADQASSVGWTSFGTADGLLDQGTGSMVITSAGALWCAYLGSATRLSNFDGEVWTHYTEDDGLPPGGVLWTGAMAVTSDGRVWVGTFGGGVCCFDGREWRTHTAEEGLLSDSVSALCAAPSGGLWCGHAVEDGGISHFDGEAWTAYPASETGGVGQFPILSMDVGPDGTLWVGSDGVSRFDGETWTHFKTELGMEVPAWSGLGRRNPPTSPPGD